jgi:hypothetical protein
MNSRVVLQLGSFAVWVTRCRADWGFHIATFNWTWNPPERGWYWQIGPIEFSWCVPIKP